jgi:hypothetical protein
MQRHSTAIAQKMEEECKPKAFIAEALVAMPRLNI